MLTLRHAGFTLMEVMLVILLMGLTAAAVTMSIGNSGPQQALEKTAQQFIAATELVLDETVLSGQFIGIVVEKTSYQFVFIKMVNGIHWKRTEFCLKNKWNLVW